MPPDNQTNQWMQNDLRDDSRQINAFILIRSAGETEFRQKDHDFQNSTVKQSERKPAHPQETK